MIRRLTKSPMVCGMMFLDVGAAVEAKSPGLAMDVSGHGPAVIFESGLGQGRQTGTGMPVASTIGIFLIPMLYVVFKRMREWGHGRFARRRQQVANDD